MKFNKNIGPVLGLVVAAVLVLWLTLGRSKKDAAVADASNSEEHGHGSEEEGHEHEEGGHDETLVLTDEQVKAAGIELVAAGPGELDIEASLPGEVKLNADNLSHIVPRFGGAITQIHKNLGDRVGKGETLAVIESNESLASYQIKALTAGTIIQKHATIGEVVPENTEVFVVANLETVWIDMNVYPKDLPYVQEGQTVHVSGPAKGLVAEGKISYVGPLVSEHTRTAMARAIISNKDGKWRPGMFVTAKVAVEKVSVAIKVPKESVQNVEGKQSVFVKTAKGYLPTPVTLGRADDKYFEILEGLQAGDQFVTEGAFMLKAEKGKSEAEHEH
jgi:cobalt-zinc-cadmium efflux system membrane fusion protein